MSSDKIGKRLKDARKNLGLKQAEVAKKADISINYGNNRNVQCEWPVKVVIRLINRLYNVAQGKVIWDLN